MATGGWSRDGGALKLPFLAWRRGGPGRGTVVVPFPFLFLFGSPTWVLKYRMKKSRNGVGFALSVLPCACSFGGSGLWAASL